MWDICAKYLKFLLKYWFSERKFIEKKTTAFFGKQEKGRHKCLTVLTLYEWEIPNLQRYIFIVKTQSLFVRVSDKLISNNFSDVKKDFRFHKKMGTVGTYGEGNAGLFNL